MKKKSRFLTGLLSAVMALSLFALPAAADETNVATIDTTKKGSLTIEKYEDDLTKPLAGVEFTIYKVADIEQVKDDDGNVSVSYKSLVNGVQIDASTKYDDIKDKISTSTITAAGKEKTVLNAEGNKASVTFNNLKLGVYLVEESDAPSQVVTRSANFLVSIPMTNKTRDGWVYNVVAQPKNTTVYGGITLVKYGKSGNNGEVALAGATFVLQRKEKDGATWTTLKKQDDGKWVANEGTNLTNAILTTSDEGTIIVDNLEPGDYRFIEISAPNGYIVDGKTTYTFTIKTDDKGKLTYDIPTEYKNGDADSIKVVNEKPELDKTVKADADYKNDADYSVGDMVKWKVSATVPSNVDKLKTFKITDKMSAQLTWEEGEAAFEIKADKDVTIENTDYTLTTPKDGAVGGEWVIEFNDTGKEKLKKNGVTCIDVTFKTKLNESANIGTAGNLNDAQLDYSNAIYPTTEEQPDNPNGGKDPETDVIKDQAIVYTFKLDAVKVDGSNVNKKLKGAEFDLYRYEGTKDDPTEADLKGDNHKVGNYVSGEDGVLAISGLKKGNYYLVETKAPTYKDDKGNEHSYNLLKEPVKVAIQPTYTTTTKNTTTTVDGVTTTKTEIDTKTFTENGTDGHFSVTIKNNKGFDLPVTGGFGTLLFSAIGALLVVGGVGVLMSTKKKKGNG